MIELILVGDVLIDIVYIYLIQDDVGFTHTLTSWSSTLPRSSTLTPTLTKYLTHTTSGKFKNSASMSIVGGASGEGRDKQKRKVHIVRPAVLIFISLFSFTGNNCYCSNFESNQRVVDPEWSALNGQLSRKSQGSGKDISCR